MALCVPVADAAIRELRLSAKLSQAEFASRLDVALVTYRGWDSGRRCPPPEAIVKARELTAHGPDDQLVELRVLATLIGVSVYLLRRAAKDGRLAVTYDNRVVYGRPVPRATRAAGAAYREAYYGKNARWAPRPEGPPVLPSVPPDYDRQLVQIRRRFGLSQAELAARVGAAGKAVVYQWESRKRRPAPQFWARVLQVRGSHRVGPGATDFA